MIRLLAVLALLLGLAQSTANSQPAPATAPPTPKVGSVWTYVGPTGPAWVEGASSVLGSTAVGDGITDDTAAFNNALTALGAAKGGILLVPPKRYKLAGSLNIPGNTTLQCAFGFSDNQDDDRPRLGTMPALMLASTASIQASGGSASIIGCHIQRDGMVFPAPNAGSYAGVAVKDAGFSNFAVIDSVIIGFQTCVFIQGSRPYMRRVYTDCSGESGVGFTGAAIEVNNGNYDLGYFHDIKLQPIATGNGHCTNSTRPGYGMAIHGINYVSNITSLNFKKAQIVIGGGTLVTGGGTIWTDYVWENSSHTLCDITGTVGLQLNGSIIAPTVNVNGTKTGIKVDFINATSWIGAVYGNIIGEDCVLAWFGTMHIDALFTNAIGTKNCGRYAIEFPDGSAAGITVGSAWLKGVNNNVTPYIHTAHTGSLANTPVLGQGGALSVGNMKTDLAAGVTPYSPTFAVGSGSDDMTSTTAVTIGASCTGLGTGGTCTVLGNSTMRRGIIRLTAGTGAAVTGQVSINFPIKTATVRGCVFVALAAGNWTAPITFQINQVSTTQMMTVWTNALALTNAVVYDIVYQCSNG